LKKKNVFAPGSAEIRRLYELKFHNQNGIIGVFGDSDFCFVLLRIGKPFPEKKNKNKASDTKVFITRLCRNPAI